MPGKSSWFLFPLPFILITTAILWAIGFFIFDEPVLWLIIGILAGLLKVAIFALIVRGSISRQAKTLPLHPTKDARIFMIVEDLCLAHGFPTPQLRIIKSRSIGVMAYGLKEENAVVAVTIGAQKKLNPVEMEAALAHMLCRIRLGITGLETWIIALAKIFPKNQKAAFHRRIFHPDSIINADIESAKLTRHPPALISALEKMAEEEEEKHQSIVNVLGFKRYSSERIPALKEFWDIY